MKIYRGIADFHPIKNAVVTTGTFDGVHIGHQKILNRIQELAKAIDGETVIITFFPHPRLVLYPEDNNLKLINTLEEKISLLQARGIDHLLIIPFTPEFSRLTSEQFIREILIDKINTKKLVIGYDHHFGRNREGSFEHLKQYAPQYGFEVEEIPEQDVNDVAVSSTKIRAAIEECAVETANTYLGYPFSISGKVIKGDQIGRTLGYPTANLYIEQRYKLLPGDGIYAVAVHHQEQSHKGMLYIGHRPTIEGMQRNIEVNILDFDQDIYDETLTVDLLHFIRPDQKFNGLEALIAQMDKDLAKTRELLG